VKRLTGATDPALPAFDLLCSCVPTPPRTSLISIYAARNKTDRLHDERLRRMRRVTSVAVPIAEHNVVYDALRRGQLKQFLGFALGLHDSMSWLPREDTVSVALSARASLLLRAKRAWQRRRDGGLGPAQAMGSLVSQGMRRLRTGRVTAGSR
jgi:hypothetical protein